MRFSALFESLLKKNSYSQSTFLIFLSKGLIVVITFLLTPLIARFYSPSDYGTYAIVNSLAGFFVLLSTWSLSSEIVVCKSEDLASLIRFIFQIAIGFSIILSAIVYLFKDIIFGLLNLQEVHSGYILILPIFVLVITATEVFASFNIRNKEFRTNVVVNTTETVLNKLSALSLGFLKLTNFGLLIADFLGKIINIVVQGISLMRGRAHGIGFNWQDVFLFSSVLKQFSKYKPYWKFHLPALLSNRLSAHVIIWFLFIWFSGDELGYYTMAISLLSIPLHLFSNSFQPIIMSKLSSVKEKVNRVQVFDTMMILLIALSFCVYLLIFLVSPWVVPVYLGPNWSGSVVFVKVMCLGFVFTMIGNSVSGLNVVFNFQKQNFYVRLLFTVLLISAMSLIYIWKVDVVSVVFITVLITVVEELVKLFLLRIKIKEYSNE